MDKDLVLAVKRQSEGAATKDDLNLIVGKSASTIWHAKKEAGLTRVGHTNRRKGLPRSTGIQGSVERQDVYQKMLELEYSEWTAKTYSSPCMLHKGKKIVENEIRNRHSSSKDVERVCNKCGVIKPNTIEFFPRSRKNLLHVCKKCSYEHYQKPWKKAHPGNDPQKMRSRSLKRKFDITQDQYNRLFESQNHCCVICKTMYDKQKHKRMFPVDHNHKTNRIRGILCMPCNALLGHAKDTIEILENAIHYLKSHQEVTNGENI